MCRPTLPKGNEKGGNNRGSRKIPCNMSKNKKIVATKAGAVITKPKRPLTAYNLFFKSERAKLLGINPSAMHPSSDVKGKRKHRKSHGKIGFIPLTRHISSRWKSLDEVTKSSFHEIYRKNRIEYLEELQRYNQAVEASKSSTATTKDRYATGNSPIHVPEMIISTDNTPASFICTESNVGSGDEFSKDVSKRSFRSVFPSFKNEGASTVGNTKDAMAPRTTSLILRGRMQRMLMEIKVERLDEMVEPLIDITSIKNTSSGERNQLPTKRISIEISKSNGDVGQSLTHASALQSNDTVCREAGFEAVKTMQVIDTLQQQIDLSCFNLSSSTRLDEGSESLRASSQQTVETTLSVAPSEMTTSYPEDPAQDELFSDEDVGLLLDMLIQ